MPREDENIEIFGGDDLDLFDTGPTSTSVSSTIKKKSPLKKVLAAVCAAVVAVSIGGAVYLAQSTPTQAEETIKYSIGGNTVNSENEYAAQIISTAENFLERYNTMADTLKGFGGVVTSQSSAEVILRQAQGIQDEKATILSLLADAGFYGDDLYNEIGKLSDLPLEYLNPSLGIEDVTTTSVSPDSEFISETEVDDSMVTYLDEQDNSAVAGEEAGIVQAEGEENIVDNDLPETQEDEVTIDVIE